MTFRLDRIVWFSRQRRYGSILLTVAALTIVLVWLASHSHRELTHMVITAIAPILVAFVMGSTLRPASYVIDVTLPLRPETWEMAAMFVVSMMQISLTTLALHRYSDDPYEVFSYSPMLLKSILSTSLVILVASFIPSMLSWIVLVAFLVAPIRQLLQNPTITLEDMDGIFWWPTSQNTSELVWLVVIVTPLAIGIYGRQYRRHRW